MNKRMTIAYLLAEISSWGWEVRISSHSDSKHGIGYNVGIDSPDYMAGLSVNIVPGHDEDLRAALQTLIQRARLLKLT